MTPCRFRRRSMAKCLCEGIPAAERGQVQMLERIIENHRTMRGRVSTDSPFCRGGGFLLRYGSAVTAPSEGAPVASLSGDRCGTKAKRTKIGRPQTAPHNIPANSLRHDPQYKGRAFNLTASARLCDISRTTAYKYIGLLEEGPCILSLIAVRFGVIIIPTDRVLVS